MMQEPEGQEGGFPYNPSQQPPEDYPPQVSPPQESGSQGQDESKNTKKIIYVVIGILVLIIFCLIFFGSGNRESITGVPGDGKCAIEENCLDQPDDCKCRAGTVCSSETKKCVSEESAPLSRDEIANITASRKQQDEASHLLGNGKCDRAYENCFDTPKECPCAIGEYCSDRKECVKPKCGNKICELIEGPESCCLDCKCTVAGQYCNNQTLACAVANMSLTEERAKEVARGYFEGHGFSVVSVESIGVIEYNGVLIQRIKVQTLGDISFRYLGITETEEVLELNI